MHCTVRITGTIALRKFFLKLHIKLCVFCGKFNSQVMESQDMCRCFKEHEDEVIGEQPHLDPARKEALQLLVRKSRNLETNWSVHLLQ